LGRGSRMTAKKQFSTFLVCFNIWNTEIGRKQRTKMRLKYGKRQWIHSHFENQMRTQVWKVADGLGSERGSGNLQLGQRVANDCKNNFQQKSSQKLSFKK
jgi:hypothetical protein